MELEKIFTNLDRLTSIYELSEIDFSNITIQYIKHASEDESIRIAFDFNNFPSSPPQKWLNNNYNTVQIVLYLFDIYTFKQKGICSDKMKLNLKFSSENNRKSLIIGDINSAFFMLIDFDWCFIEKVSAYRLDVADKLVK